MTIIDRLRRQRLCCRLRGDYRQRRQRRLCGCGRRNRRLHYGLTITAFYANAVFIKRMRCAGAYHFAFTIGKKNLTAIGAYVCAACHVDYYMLHFRGGNNFSFAPTGYVFLVQDIAVRTVGQIPAKRAFPLSVQAMRFIALSADSKNLFSNLFTAIRAKDFPRAVIGVRMAFCIL